jgi:hypothetical protein
MKIGTLILIGITLSLIGLWAIAYNNESGDSNAILMYFTVYGIVAIGIGITNLIWIIERILTENKKASV